MPDTKCWPCAQVPVLANDWMIHPLQIVEAKQTGASGVLVRRCLPLPGGMLQAAASCATCHPRLG